MNILYTSDGEAQAIMTLDALIANFRIDAANAGYSESAEADMRDELESRGWYEGMHDLGRYLVLNLAKFDQTIQPTSYWR
jgi:hypothetical protein